MVFNATFNNISAISWKSVLFIDETGVFGENHQPISDILKNDQNDASFCHFQQDLEAALDFWILHLQVLIYSICHDV
jgi:hypothetical protein